MHKWLPNLVAKFWLPNLVLYQTDNGFDQPWSHLFYNTTPCSCMNCVWIWSLSCGNWSAKHVVSWWMDACRCRGSLIVNSLVQNQIWKPKFWLPTLVTSGHRLPKLVANISSHFHHWVNTGLAVGSRVKWLPIKVANPSKIDKFEWFIARQLKMAPSDCNHF